MKINLQQVQMNFILIEVCRLHEVRKVDVLGPSRLRVLADARKYFCYYVRAINPDITIVDIGKFLNRDHSTVCHNLDALNGWMDMDKTFEKVINKTLKTIALRVSNKMLKFVETLPESPGCLVIETKKVDLMPTFFAA